MSVEASNSPDPTASGTRSERQERQNHRYVSPSMTDLVFDRESGPPSGRVVYMGDSSNMKYLVHEVGDPFKTFGSSRLWGDHLQRSLMERLGSSTQSKLSSLRSQDEEYLREIGALTPLDAQLSEELIEVFFDQAFPFFPVFDKTEFWTSKERNQISPLVLNALYCVAAIHCAGQLIQRLGFESRYLACSTFYRRAKALHETDYDTEGVSNLQAGILLMNWWGGPMEQKDTWYWLGVATNLAQALGMHRSKSYSLLPAERQKLWRRIWWVLFINDIHHAAVFGRPPHIHSQYCDVEPLNVVDMSTSTSSSADSVLEESGLLLVDMCQLAILVDKCLLNKFSTTSNPQAVRQVYTELTNCPSAFLSSFSPAPSSLTVSQGYYPSVLRLMHLDYMIVIHRMLSSDLPLSTATNLDTSFQSAGLISRILEDLLSSPASDLVLRLPFLSFPAIFCSVLINVIHMRKESGNIQVLARHRADLAMVVLDQLQDRWPLVVWTRHLLKLLLKDATYPATMHPSTDTSGSSEQQQRQPAGERNVHPIEISSVGPSIATVSRTSSRHHHHDLGNASRSSGKDASFPSRLQEGFSIPRSDHLRFNPTASAAAASSDVSSFSPMPFMFPLNGFLEDAGMEFEPWLLDLGLDESSSS